MTRLFITLTVPEVQTAFRGYILNFPKDNAIDRPLMCFC